jgi:K(+)-stimulated pyrophosphate-energized sodium pump
VPIIIFIVIYLVYRSIIKQSTGNEKMTFLAKIIQLGAMTFLKREYFFLTIFAIIIAIIFALVPQLGSISALTFILGCLLPAIAGYIGMKTATSASVRTTQAALEKGEASAFSTAYRGGSVMGLTTQVLATVGLVGIFYLTKGSSQAMISFGLGTCFIGLFSRVGGGIYTKAADVGADLAGKIEAGIPEDDPRNPAVIADNVGDNVGDIAGMGADIFASLVNAVIATGLIGTSLNIPNAYFFPLFIAGAGLTASLITFFLFPLIKRFGSAKALRISPLIASLITIIFIVYENFSQKTIDFSQFSGEWFFFLAPSATVLLGIIGGNLIGLVTEWYTSKSPVRKIAVASQAGAGSNIIRGLSVGMESTILPLFIVCAVMIFSYLFLGSYGIGVAATAMLATIATTVSIDAYGPISDNAGGIAEMAGLDSKVRDITDKLDTLGNTTAAIGKGFAMGSAILTSLALIIAFINFLLQHITLAGNALTLIDPYMILGLFFGGMLTFSFSSLTMKAVGNTAISMVEEVRRQFKEIPGLMEGKADPDYKACIDISTSAALKKMLLPGFIAIIVPILCLFIFGSQNYRVIAGILGGTLITGSFMALFMTNAGGAWDNAKKYIEAGKLEGHKKGSDSHKAAVTGDTVGDPFKDTSGPSLNILIKLVSILALLLVPFII